MKQAYGGVVVNAQGQVLLREPTNHYDDYVWTFAKGRASKGETPEQTALREVREETGIEAEIVAPIPGSYAGGTTENHYWLMSPLRDLGKFDWETANIRWVSFDEARELIAETTNPVGRKRDLAVLQAAEKLVAP